MPTIRKKHNRLRFEARQQIEVEHLWKSLKRVVEIDIFKTLCLLNTQDEYINYLNSLESLFIDKATNYGVRRYKIKSSKAFGVLTKITRKYDLNPSALKLAITQVRTCADRKANHAVFT